MYNAKEDKWSGKSIFHIAIHIFALQCMLWSPCFDEWKIRILPCCCCDMYCDRIFVLLFHCWWGNWFNSYWTLQSSYWQLNYKFEFNLISWRFVLQTFGTILYHDTFNHSFMIQKKQSKITLEQFLLKWNLHMISELLHIIIHSLKVKLQ